MIPCDHCGRLFAAPRGGRFCRPACRTAAWKRDRDAEAARVTDDRDRLEALLVALRDAPSA